MENNERILISELRDSKYIDPKKYSILLLKKLEAKEYVKLLFNEQDEVTYIGKGKWFSEALEIFLNK